MAQDVIPLAIIGGGTMAGVIIEGACAAGILQPAKVVVAEPDTGKHDILKRMGVQVRTSGEAALAWLAVQEKTPGAGQILLAVKPQSLADVGLELAPILSGEGKPKRTVISILAGTPTLKVHEALGGNVAVIRAMPNTPARVRQAVTAVAIGQGAVDADSALAERLFGGVGQVVLRIDEGMMDGFTAVAGSGPAYVFFLAQALVEAAVALGLDEPTAVQVVRHTVAGSGALLAASSQTPGELLAAVVSKGGTTQAALGVLGRADVHGSVIAAVTAARDRGRELGAL